MKRDDIDRAIERGSKAPERLRGTLGNARSNARLPRFLKIAGLMLGGVALFWLIAAALGG